MVFACLCYLMMQRYNDILTLQTFSQLFFTFFNLFFDLKKPATFYGSGAMA